MKSFREFLTEEDSPDAKPWLATTPEEIEASEKLKGTSPSKLRRQTEKDEKRGEQIKSFFSNLKARELLSRDQKDKNYVEKDPENFKVDEVGITNDFRVMRPMNLSAVRG